MKKNHLDRKYQKDTKLIDLLIYGSNVNNCCLDEVFNLNICFCFMHFEDAILYVI